MYYVASFPGLPTIQFLITCSLQKWRGRAWSTLSREWCFVIDMIKWTRPSPSIFAYRKQSKTGWWKGLGTRPCIRQEKERSCYSYNDLWSINIWLFPSNCYTTYKNWLTIICRFVPCQLALIEFYNHLRNLKIGLTRIHQLCFFKVFPVRGGEGINWNMTSMTSLEID